MKPLSFVLAAVLMAGAAACGDDGPSNPTSPTQTRVIGVSGNLAFGEVPVGSSRDATFTISNTGSATLTVTGIAITGGFGSALTASWTGGTIAAGASQTVNVRFAPTESGTYSGTLTVSGDQTSGTNTLPISASSVVSFTGTWRGGHIITACNGTGSMQDLACTANRGAFPIGSNMEFSATLQQSGNSVTGTVSLGGLVGPASGTVTNGVLSLRGTATGGGGFTATITSWSTTVQGNTMAGNVTYDLTFTGIPGVAGVVGQLNGVTRQ
jgi:hypothetical protein